MTNEVLQQLSPIWEWMCMGMPVEAADVIIGFGCINDDIALCCAQLYHEGIAPLILFSGGLGRNTKGRWSSSESERYREIAVSQGVPPAAILMESRSTNTGENICFSRAVLRNVGLDSGRLLCVHKPFMERRLYAAMQVYWPEADARYTSPKLDITQYIARTIAQGMTEKAVIDVIVGDVQRMERYARLGYQIPQPMPDAVRQAFSALVALGYTGELLR